MRRILRGIFVREDRHMRIRSCEDLVISCSILPRERTGFLAISHVGIIAEDTDYLIHSAPGEPTVRKELLKTREKPAFFARCSLLPQTFLYQEERVF